MKAAVFETNESTAAHRLPRTRTMVCRGVRSPALPRTEDFAVARGMLETGNDGVKVSGTAVFRTKQSTAARRLRTQS